MSRFTEHRCAQGRVLRTLESHAGVIRNARGEIENILIVARDITERKLAEKERELMEVQLRLAQKMESIGRLAAGIAHEINTPIQYIGDNARFLKDAFTDLRQLVARFGNLIDAAPPKAFSDDSLAELRSLSQNADVEYLTQEIPKAIEQSLEGVERVAKIISAMKEFSHPGTEERTSVDLNKAIESTLTVTRNEWKYVADVVTISPRSADDSVPGRELNQVILNLIVNAAHAIAAASENGTRGKGTITVTTRECGDWVEIRIADTGPESQRTFATES